MEKEEFFWVVFCCDKGVVVGFWDGEKGWEVVREVLGRCLGSYFCDVEGV